MDESDLGYDVGDGGLYESDIYAQLRGGRVWDSEQLELYREAYQKGMGGIAGLITLLGNTPIAAVNMPAENAVRSWQVTLLAMQLPGGANQAAFPAAIDPPPPGQYGLDYVRSVVQTNDATFGAFKARVEFGTANAMERAWLDYPYSGGTFEVSAAYVRLFVEVPGAFFASFFGQPPPVVGAFITPSDRPKAATVFPTYTQKPRLVPAGSQLAFFMPPRAYAYRVFTNESAASWGAATTLSTYQGGFNGGRIRTDLVAVTPWATTQANGGQDWVLCDPTGVNVWVSHSDGLSAHTIGVQYTLDLG
jgi:hypothetical protein